LDSIVFSFKTNWLCGYGAMPLRGTSPDANRLDLFCGAEVTAVPRFGGIHRRCRSANIKDHLEDLKGWQISFPITIVTG
jgi:hypothetical protein